MKNCEACEYKDECKNNDKIKIREDMKKFYEFITTSGHIVYNSDIHVSMNEAPDFGDLIGTRIHEFEREYRGEFVDVNLERRSE